MKPTYLLIGEHWVEITCSSDSLRTMLEAAFRPAYCIKDHQRPDLIVHLEEGYGGPFTNYDVDVYKNGAEVTFSRADYLIETNRSYSVSRISVWDELALKHALMNLYSSYIVHHNWGLLIHSSCVVEGQYAYMFAGPSGAGKSTVARLSTPRMLLSDEATLVKITQEHVTVLNSPFRSELTVTGDETPRELAGIHLLIQAPYNRRVGLSSADGLIQIMNKVFYWEEDSEAVRHVWHLMRSLARAVPMYELHFQQNDTFWELIHNDSVYLELPV